MDSLHLRGLFTFEHWYHGRNIDLCQCHNDVTNEGKSRFLNVGFHGDPNVTSWWLGIINDSGYSAIAVTDTYRSIGHSNGWSEFIDYTDTNNGDSATTRPLWVTNAASGQSITNTTQAIFTTTSISTIRGLFVVGGSANAQIKGDNFASNSVLWSTALFDAAYIVYPGSVLRIIYTINA
ncbi:MAG: hypothetical protein WC919_01760 [Candidatus Paceibacterota bacterium]|jgi:hypothetical protein